jgi:DNA-directed RNA polymerase subunit RPC12/RpoP
MSGATQETQTFPCPDCGYQVDPSTGLQCARCGATLNCSSLSCSECDACSGVFDELRRVTRQQFGGD